MIQLKDDTSADEWNVSRQRLSLCKSEMLHSTPWTGTLRKATEKTTNTTQSQQGFRKLPVRTILELLIQVLTQVIRETMLNSPPIRTPARFSQPQVSL